MKTIIALALAPVAGYLAAALIPLYGWLALSTFATLMVFYKNATYNG